MDLGWIETIAFENKDRRISKENDYQSIVRSLENC